MNTTLKISTLLLAAVCMSFTAGSTKSAKPASSSVFATKTSIKWKSTEITLGEIPQNKPVTIEFEFTNEGDTPVLITQVQASCGCTSTNFVKTPVLAGESTKITAVFNAATKGLFHKQVTVTTNAEESPRTLTFTGTVI